MNTPSRSARRATKKSKRIKLPSIEKLAAELERLQKQVVIKFYGTDCYTCPNKNLEGANRQLGHMPWPRQRLSTICKYDYRFTRIQCAGCNGPGGQGMGATATLRMQAEGIDVQELWNYNIQTKGITCPRQWWNDQIVIYKELLSQ